VAEEEQNFLVAFLSSLLLCGFDSLFTLWWEEENSSFFRDPWSLGGCCRRKASKKNLLLFISPDFILLTHFWLVSFSLCFFIPNFLSNFLFLSSR
jgi:hypothetical protein